MRDIQWTFYSPSYSPFSLEIGFIQWKEWNQAKEWKFRLTSVFRDLGQLVENITGA